MPRPKTSDRGTPRSTGARAAASGWLRVLSVRVSSSRGAPVFVGCRQAERSRDRARAGAPVPPSRAVTDGEAPEQRDGDVRHLDQQLRGLARCASRPSPDRWPMKGWGDSGRWRCCILVMGYADGGGLTAVGRARREAVRFEAVEMFGQGMRPPDLVAAGPGSAGQGDGEGIVEALALPSAQQRNRLRHPGRAEPCLPVREHGVILGRDCHENDDSDSRT